MTISDDHRHRASGMAVTEVLFHPVRSVGCDGIWLSTDPDSEAALAPYRKIDRMSGHLLVLAGTAPLTGIDPDV